MFGVVNGFDDKSVVAGKVEKGARFAWRSEFGENVLCCEGKKVICGVYPKKFLAESAKNPWGIILKLEVIFSGRCQFVPDATPNQ